MKKEKIISAKEFYKTIKKEEDKFKLINKLFIVKYLDKDFCIIIASFEKKNSVFNNTKTNKINFNNFHLINKIYYPKEKLILKEEKGFKRVSSLNIAWIEEDIKNILN